MTPVVEFSRRIDLHFQLEVVASFFPTPFVSGWFDSLSLGSVLPLASAFFFFLLFFFFFFFFFSFGSQRRRVTEKKTLARSHFLFRLHTADQVGPVAKWQTSDSREQIYWRFLYNIVQWTWRRACKRRRRWSTEKKYECPNKSTRHEPNSCGSSVTITKTKLNAISIKEDTVASSRPGEDFPNRMADAGNAIREETAARRLATATGAIRMGFIKTITRRSKDGQGKAMKGTTIAAVFPSSAGPTHNKMWQMRGRRNSRLLPRR